MTKRFTPFFAPKNLIRYLIIVGAGFILLYTGSFTYYAAVHRRQAVGLKARQQAFQQLSPAEQSIRKAQAYLEGSITQVKPVERLFLDYLQRKYKLDNKLGINGPPFDLSEDPRTYPEEIHYLARIAFPDKVVTVLPKSPFQGLSLTNVYSANCDHLALPAEFWPVIKENMDKGGYFLSHNALALAFMKDNNCLLPANFASLPEQVQQGLISIAGDDNTPPDLRYEAAAFLSFISQKKLIQSKWIDQIIAEQRSDGSWSEEAKAGKPSSHTTVLALWTLLEYARSDTPEQPLIRHTVNP